MCFGRQGKGGVREQGRNMGATGRGQQEGPARFLNPLPPPPTPSTSPCCMQLALILLHRDSGLQLVMSECPFCWLVGCWISMVGSCATEMVLF